MPISRMKFNELEEKEEKIMSGTFDLEDAETSGRNDRKASKPKHIHCGWLFVNGKFLPEKDAISKIPSGVYEVGYDCNLGYFLQNVQLNDESILYHNKHINEIINYVKKFWDSRNEFSTHDMNYKRGVLMYGPPGSGKSCIIRALALETVKRGGIVIILRSSKNNVSLSSVSELLSSIRRTEKTRMIMMCIEDIEGYVQEYESALINLIDGTDSINNVIYIATTNFIKQLPPRLVRPSRFDNIVEVKVPDRDEREAYLKHLYKPNDIELKKHWYSDTEGMSYAELKELFIAVNIFGKDFYEVKKRFKREYGKEIA